MKRLIFLGLMLFFISLPMSQLQAHGLGKQQLERVEVGSFLVTVWTDPDPVLADQELHVTIGIEYENGLLLNAQVDIIANSLDDTDLHESASATHDNAVNKLHYEAPLILEKGGQWQITIAITDDEGEGQVSFNLDVEEGDQNLPWTWIGAGIIGLSIIGLVVFNRLKLNREQKEVHNT